MAIKKGQMFVLAALMFSSLILLVGFSYGEVITSGESSNIKNYFDRAKNDHIQTFNQELEKNYSSDRLEKKLYNTNRFILRRSNSKAIKYTSIQFLILPDKGNLKIINYRDNPLEPNITIEDTDYNPYIGAKQSKDLSVSKGGKNISIHVESVKINKSFEAYNPRLLNFIEMESENERWRSSTLH